MGYVLVKCKKESIREVYREMEKLEEVKDIYVVNGEYDIIAKIETKSITEVPSAVLKIRFLDGVIATKTFTIVNIE